MARRMGRPDLLSAALDSRGATSLQVGGYGMVKVDQDERLALVPRLENQTEVMDIYSTSAWTATHVGHFRLASDYATRAVELTTSLGINIPAPASFLAVSQYRLGEWDAFWSTFAAAEAFIDPERPLRYHALRMYGAAAYLHEVAGNPIAADRLIERIDVSVQGNVGASGARLWIVMVLARRGAFLEARRRLAVEDPVRGIQNRDLDLEAWADLVAAEGKWDDAPAVIAHAREVASHSGFLLLPAVADRLDGHAALANGELEPAIRLLEQARAAFTSLEAPWERARTELSLAQAYVAAARGAEAAPAAQAALKTFTALHAAVETERATALATPAKETA